MIRTAGQCVVGPKGVEVEVTAEGLFVVTAEGLAGDDVVGSVVATDVAEDGVATGYRHS
jgi:hypothetical protein